MDTADYVGTIERDLAATYQVPGSERRPYYEEVEPDLLQVLLEDAKALVKEGVERGFIHPKDGIMMIPTEVRPGRYYGLPKLHKSRKSWPARQNIPPLRPIVSASGTITENISHWIDQQSKQEVRKLDSYVEDTRYLLEIIQEENRRGPQPPGTVPVTLDVKGMYNNVPMEQGLKAFQEAM